MKTPGSLSKRSASMLSSLIKMSTTPSGNTSNNSLSPSSHYPHVTSIFSTVNTTTEATQNSKISPSYTKNSPQEHQLTSILKASKSNVSRPHSLINEFSSFNSNNSPLTSINKLNNSKVISGNGSEYSHGSAGPTEFKLNHYTAQDWSVNMIKTWLGRLGMLPAQIKNAMKHVQNGKSLLNLSDSDLEKIFLINNGMHKRKLKLALEELRNPEKW